MSFHKIGAKYCCGFTTIKECLVYKGIPIRLNNHNKKIVNSTAVIDKVV
jgi:hypothetical protein